MDVIISDWMMPEVDGLELCARVRESEHDGDADGLYTFFVFLTALGDKEHLLEGMRAGADGYLSKNTAASPSAVEGALTSGANTTASTSKDDTTLVRREYVGGF